jgi:hypothetical protein
MTSPCAIAINRLMAEALPLRCVSTSTVTTGLVLATSCASSIVRSVQPGDHDDLGDGGGPKLLGQQGMERPPDILRFVVGEHADGTANHRVASPSDSVAGVTDGLSCVFSHRHPTRMRLGGSHSIEL